jgi:hypothetical protein
MSHDEALEVLRNWVKADKVTTPGAGVQTRLGEAIEAVLGYLSDIRSREETALKEVEFLCRQLDVLGYHKGANLSRARCGLPEVAHG